jgi:hypothetical protein
MISILSVSKTTLFTIRNQIPYHTYNMPRLELEDPELRALGAVQQMIAPLIAKRILDDTKGISSLAVTNSRRLFKYEVDQIFLCIAKGQNLPQDDYKAFFDGLHQFFQLLEDLIDERAFGLTKSSRDTMEKTECHSTAPCEEESSKMPTLYPKLAALMKRASDEPTSSDLSTLICLPETVGRSKEIEKTITDFNAGNITRFNTTASQGTEDINYMSARSDKILDKTTSKPELKNIEKSRQCLSSLLSALKEKIDTSTCNSNHIAKLQTQHPDGSTESTIGVQHKIFISCCSVKDKWQETTCTVVSQL